jgi:hypothetical protein
MHPLEEFRTRFTRRRLLGRMAGGLGGTALAALLQGERSTALAAAGNTVTGTGATSALAGLPHFAARAKRIIYLFQSGGPAHMDLFDYKPRMHELHGTELPDSVRQGQRVTLMTASQKNFPCAAPRFSFARHGEAGTWVSETLPHIARSVNDIAVIKSLHTEAINHDPAITFINTGSQQLGKPSLGAWLSYGLGSDNDELPTYVVLISKGSGLRGGQPVFARLWGNGFLPSNHQGVRFRSGKDPVLYLSNPPGIDRATRRRMLARLEALHELRAEQTADPEIATRIAQFEMAFRMQRSVPELTDLSGEPERTFELYGPESRKPGTFAANCVLARRMAERGVRFVQLFHRGWDQHGNLPKAIRAQCSDVDQPSAGLLRDLKDRGLLDDTLVLWGGEFGRTIYCQGKLTRESYGRDHHGRCFTMWMAGGGIQGGIEHGATDDFAYNVVRDPVHTRDINATILHTLGIDHTRFTYPFQGLDQRLTGVEEEARVVHEILS